ncbi:MAG: SRPBCC family protein [Myxococcota bacterium]
MRSLLVGLVVLVAIFVAAVQSRPDRYTVVREKVVAAPAPAVYGLVSDFHGWRQWSPWDELDPDMTRTFGGSASGEGATYAWKGNDDVGEGNMTITSVVPDRNVTIDLNFVQPFSAENVTRFDFIPQGEGTKVTWTMDASSGGFVGKAMGLFMDFDAMIGDDFVKGLDKLEAAAKLHAQTSSVAAG